MTQNEETAEDVQQDTENVEESEADTENQDSEEDSTDWKAEASKFRRLLEKEKQNKEKEESKPLPKEPKEFDSASLERRIEEKVSLRMKGYEPEHIEEIERYAKGAGLDSLLEAEKSPIIQKGLAALQAEKKSEESTPAPSNKVRLVGGKPADEVLRDPDAPASDKQAAFEARMKRN